MPQEAKRDNVVPLKPGAPAGQEITLFKSSSPDRLSKSFDIDDDGGLIKLPPVVAVQQATALTFDASDIDQMVFALGKATDSVDLAILPGCFDGHPGFDRKNDQFRVITEAVLAAKLQTTDRRALIGIHDISGTRYAARLKDAMLPGSWLLLDCDNPPGIPDEWRNASIPERLEMLEPILPGISTCERIELRSSSSRVVPPGGEPGPASHAWIRISHPHKLELLRSLVSIDIVAKDVWFKSPRHSRETGDVIGFGIRTVIDLAVWVPGRLVFCAKPLISEAMRDAGWTVADAGITVVNAGGGMLDVSQIKKPGRDRLKVFKKKTGKTISMEADKNGRVRTTVYGELRLNTPIEIKGEIKTLAEWEKDIPEGGKLRCETPFRASQSEAAFIARTGENGKLILHDVGVDTTYPCADVSTDKPTITVSSGTMAPVTRLAERKLVETKRAIYQRAGMLVRPMRLPKKGFRNRATSKVSLIALNAPFLHYELADAITWVQMDGKGECYPVDPPPIVAKTILGRVGLWPFAEIRQVTTAPTIREDGSLVEVAGFDQATGLLLVDPPELVGMQEYPTKDDARAAVALLEELFAEFPFGSEVDKAIALAYALTIAVRHILAVAPLFAFTAPTPGSGKSFLVDVICAMFLGNIVPVVAASDDPKEFEKRLAAELIEGSTMVAIDNINNVVASDLLCQFVERPVVSIRILGVSEAVKIENVHTISITGNNLQPSGDLVRRSLLCKLDPRVERPELRKFAGNPFERVLEDRGTYIGACLTIVRAYIYAGFPDVLPALASFEDWSKYVRSALVWAGCADPAASIEELRGDDPTIAAIKTLLNEWEHVFGTEPQRLGEVIKEAYRRDSLNADHVNQGLLDAIGVACGRNISAQMLGKYLGKHKGRFYDDKCFKFFWDSHAKTNVWAVDYSDTAVTTPAKRKQGFWSSPFDRVEPMPDDEI